MSHATATWTGAGQAFEIEGGSGHVSTVDNVTQQNPGAGMRPTEMLLGALAACAGVNMVLLLEKMRQPMKTLSIAVEGDQEPDWPHRFTKIRMRFDLEWDGDPDPALVSKAIDLSVNHYCPVHATLSHGVEIEHGLG